MMFAESVFDYYYGDEGNQFSFCRIPRQLITGGAFKGLSTDAKLLYYDEETERFDDNTGSLATPCRIGLVDNGDGTYTVESGLLPPSGGQYGSVMKEVFGPLDELYQAYTAEGGVGLDAVRSFPSSEELWEMYRKAANFQ